MLYEAIIAGSKVFHTEEPRARFYDDYISEKRWELWSSPDTINLAEIDRLILFLNQWSSRYESSQEQQHRLLDAIREVYPLFLALAGESLLSIDFKRPLVSDLTVVEAIERIFRLIATAGSRDEATATSKILDTINPELFVMWDTSIRLGYNVPLGFAYDYAYRFLPRMQKMAERAVNEYAGIHKVSREEATKALCQCGHTLAKVVDEYNYAKFTLKDKDEIWETEFDYRLLTLKSL